ncbi:Unknown protein [Striga hermonthica]|uniref:Uncharacterized protein n=1 Tax=Striga hermonthica TaxID=68872 RepID=A0A9N7MYX6_STRHE|nr:Unknown protein [Striga hermonthica]
MRRQIVLRSAPSGSCRRQLLEGSECSSRGGGRRAAEVAGGAVAECAAVCCCCPCGLANLLVLVAYKVPAGLCRKALRRKRRRKLMEAGPARRTKCGCDEREVGVTSPLSLVTAVSESNPELMKLEKEMWDQFYSAGFWRSPSQRSEISAITK